MIEKVLRGFVWDASRVQARQSEECRVKSAECGVQGALALSAERRSTGCTRRFTSGEYRFQEKRFEQCALSIQPAGWAALSLGALLTSAWLLYSHTDSRRLTENLPNLNIDYQFCNIVLHKPRELLHSWGWTSQGVVCKFESNFPAQDVPGFFLSFFLA